MGRPRWPFTHYESVDIEMRHLWRKFFEKTVSPQTARFRHLHHNGRLGLSESAAVGTLSLRYDDDMGEEVLDAFDTCLEGVDRLARSLRRGIITHRELESSVLGLLEKYFDSYFDTDATFDTERVDDDIDFLLSYAREPIERLANDPVVGDRNATDRFDRFVRRRLHYPTTQANLREILDQVGPAGEGDPSVIVDLCATGHSDHPRIFLFSEFALETIKAARDFGSVRALVAAVDPRDHSWQQLGFPDHHGGLPRKFTFVCLAELAIQRNPVGDQALDVLVEMCRYWQTAALASVHLPAHRLSREHRGALADCAEALDDLLDADMLRVPGCGAERAPAAIRSVLWLASDAKHLYL